MSELTTPTSAAVALQRLMSIMAHLRDPAHGCDWDLAQNFATIAPYTIEEAYEVADAIERDDMAALKDELGDLLLQVVFHARIAQEADLFDFAAVADAISEKMATRHPHIFGDAPNLGQTRETRWESLKAQERAANGNGGAMDGVALALPALLRADKLQKRAARTGFDWPDREGPADKLREEMAELAAAVSPAHQAEEAGDLLFAAVNLVRAYGIAPEDALRAANRKFERRFRDMEALAETRGQEFSALTLDQQEILWNAVKASEPSEPA